MRWIVALLSLLMFCEVALEARARVVDGKVATDSVLREIVDKLDSKGIDIRNGSSADQDNLSRPQLTLLSNFPYDAALVARADHNSFRSAFSVGATRDRAFLVAVKWVGAQTTVEDRTFRRLWDAAPRTRRIFLSFSGADVSKAREIAETLRTIGYTVFIYKDDSGRDPSVNPVETGRYFREAGRHFVLDTVNARKSIAVNAEAEALKYNNKAAGIIPPIFTAPSPGGSSTNSTGGAGGMIPCCRICYYRNGVRMYCDPKTCSAIICGNARRPSDRLFTSPSLQVLSP